jgi:peptide/nickel transport system substrate-binding protein
MQDSRTNNRTRRIFLRGAAGTVGLAALAPVLAACGSSNNKNNNKSSNAPATSSSAPAASVAAASGSPAAGASATTIAPKSVNAASPTAASGPVKTGGTLTFGISRDPTTFDTIKSQDVYSNYVIGLVVEPLFAAASDGKGGFIIGPNLVEKSDSTDAQTYTWLLKSGVKFQDGTDFNADAVKWNIQRHIDDKTSVRNQDVSVITDMTVVDPMTLKVTLNAPNAAFLSKLTGGAGSMYSPTQFQKVGGDKVAADLTNLGSGPFKFVSWQKGVQVELDKNPSYWQKDANGTAYPYLDKIIMKPIPDENTREANLKTGDVDMIEQPPPKDLKSLQANSDLVYKQIPGLSFNFITLNTAKPPFDNKLVRQALSYALNRQEVVDTVFFGTAVVADTEIPGVLPGSKLGPYVKQDTAKAKALLQQAGQTNVSFTMTYSNASPVIEQTAQLFKAEAQAAGFNITLQPIEFATVVSDDDAGNYQASMIGWNGSADPDGFVFPLFKTGAGFNLSKISDSELDALLDKGQQTIDPATRVTVYNQIIDKLNDLQPFIIYSWGVYQQMSRKNVQNFQIGPSQYTWLYKVWKSA